MNTNENDTTQGPQSLEFAGLSSIAEEELAENSQARSEQDAQDQAEAAQAINESLEAWGGAIEAAADIVCSTFPTATPVWSQKRKEALAGALARCDEAYGWGGVGNLIGHPLVGLAFAGFPLVVGTAKAIAEERRQATIDVEAREVLTPTPRDPMAAAAGAPQAQGAEGA